MTPRTRKGRRNMAARATIPAFALLVLLLGGCATLPAPGPRFEPVELPEIPLPDLSPLEGRRIVLDPGHGGRWPGAVAESNGLRESDVNLGVALRLAEALRGAGAEVLLTRDDDTTPVPASLQQDLAARARVANDANADVFVSIHHNADAAHNAGRNDLEVYYKLGEDGPSLDLAQRLTRELARRLRRDAEAKLMLPGNYRVLRTAEVPAVLTEASFMSNPRNAAFLATDRAQQAEADALLAGLGEYFRLDPPRVEGVTAASADGGLTHELRAHLDKGIPIEGGTVRVRLNGAPAAGSVDFAGNVLLWTFAAPLANGPHVAELTGRNYRGGSFRVSVPFTVDRPPASVATEVFPRSVPRASGAEVQVRVSVHDALGLPVADGTEVTLADPPRVAVTAGGAARFYARAADLPGTLRLAAADVSVEAAVAFGSPPVRSLRVRDERSGSFVEGATVRADGYATTTTPEGWALVPGESLRATVTRDGYEPAGVTAHADAMEVVLRPVGGGVLHGRTIALDAAHGGRDTGPTGPTGVRGADISRDIVRRTAAALREAGAVAIETRDADIQKSDEQRVAVAEEHGAELYIRVLVAPGGHDAGGQGRPGVEAVWHYPGSAGGTRLAEGIAAELSGASVGPAVTYELQQTGCPAVVVRLAPLSSQEVEEAYLSPGTARAIAAGLYRAVERSFAGQ